MIKPISLTAIFSVLRKIIWYKLDATATTWLCSEVLHCSYTNISLCSKSLNPSLHISRCSSVGNAFWTVIPRLQVLAHCAPLFFFQQCLLVGIYVFTCENLQLEWLKRDESNRVYWFQPIFLSFVYLLVVFIVKVKL